MVIILLNAIFGCSLLTWFVTRGNRMSDQEQTLFAISMLMLIGNTLAITAVLMGWLPVTKGGGL